MHALELSNHVLLAILLSLIPFNVMRGIAVTWTIISVCQAQIKKRSNINISVFQSIKCR